MEEAKKNTPLEVASSSSPSKRRGSSSMTSGMICMTGLVLVLSIINLGMNAGIVTLVKDIDDSSSTTTVTNDVLLVPSNLPGFESTNFATIQNKAMTSSLNFYTWSPEGTSPRKWIDQNLIPEMQDKFGITVNRIDAVYEGCDLAPMAVVCTVDEEIKAGKTETGGSVDMIWINGANFAKMKELGFLYGPFATILPSSANFDFTDSAINLDKGVSIDGLEMPYNTAQSVFIHNEIQVPNPPKTIPDLVAWIKANPGRFTYANPNKDFMSAALIRHFFYHYAGDGFQGGSKSDLQGPFNAEIYNARAPAVWAILNEIEPSLYQRNGNPYYPDAHDDIRPLTGNETVWIDFSFQHTEASTRIQTDNSPWPVHMQAYTMNDGTIADTNYLAIPINAQNKEAALTAVNYMSSAASMFTRATPEIWGALQAFDPSAAEIKEWDVAFNYINRHEATPTVEELAAARTTDLHIDYVNKINEDWVTNVLNA